MYMAPAQIYDVIVTTNMFGDIITDLGAGHSGGNGMAASGNLNRRANRSMFGRSCRRRTSRQKLRQSIATFLQRCDDARFLVISGRTTINQACKRRSRMRKTTPRPGRRRDDFAVGRCGLRQVAS